MIHFSQISSQAFTFPHWREDLTLDFNNEREIEFLCFAEKVVRVQIITKIGIVTQYLS